MVWCIERMLTGTYRFTCEIVRHIGKSGKSEGEREREREKE